MFLHVFEFDTVTLVTVSYGKSFVCVFCWAWPRSSCCFAAFETKRKSGWGICGSSWFGLCCCMWWFAFLTGTGQLRCVLLFSLLMSLSGPCHRASTAKLDKKKKGTQCRMEQKVHGPCSRPKPTAAMGCLGTLHLPEGFQIQGRPGRSNPTNGERNTTAPTSKPTWQPFYAVPGQTPTWPSPTPECWTNKKSTRGVGANNMRK